MVLEIVIVEIKVLRIKALQIKVRQLALRDRVPVSEFGLLLLVEAEAVLRAFDRCHQIVNQSSLVHRFLHWPVFPPIRTVLLRPSLGTRFILGRARLSVVPLTPPLLSPARLKAVPSRQTLSAARNFALRARGLRSISSSPGVTGLFVSNLYCPRFAPSRIVSFTMRSSSEWKLI